ncbi:ribonuclease P protein component [Oceanospirillum sp.]|uniref:ribonuclease P protein component n=1 Tax=Oceanospirillum sp. TaxID=2021254 RepID=UPI003A9203A0
MTSYGFPRDVRLLTAGDYRSVFDDVQIKVFGRCFMILARPNTLPHPRIGQILAKKNLRRAVDRNRIRRLTRESFRLNKHQMPAMDLVLLTQKGLSDLSSEEYAHQLNLAWKRLETLHRKKLSGQKSDHKSRGKRKPRPEK